MRSSGFSITISVYWHPFMTMAWGIKKKKMYIMIFSTSSSYTVKGKLLYRMCFWNCVLQIGPSDLQLQD